MWLDQLHGKEVIVHASGQPRRKERRPGCPTKENRREFLVRMIIE